MNWLPLLPFAFFFAWLFFSVMQRRICPDCGNPLKAYQSPLTKTKRQWIEGGFVCDQCGCEADLSGSKVAAGTPISLRSILPQVAVLAVTTMSAIAMLVVLLFVINRLDESVDENVKQRLRNEAAQTSTIE